jgi:tryptophanyl-tRNA synthetase
METELVPIRARAERLRAEPAQLDQALASGAAHCRTLARETMHEVRQRMGFA